MNGPAVVLIACALVVPLTWAILAFDVWLSRRDYQRRMRGDETERFARARARIQAQQEASNTRLGHSRKDDQR